MLISRLLRTLREESRISLSPVHFSISKLPQLALHLDRCGVRLANSRWPKLGHAAFSGALQLAPEHPQVRLHRSLVNETLGHWQEAWKDAQARYQVSSARDFYPHQLTIPAWDDARNEPGPVLVHWEQGFGDVIQYARFLSPAAQILGDLVFECPPPLFALMQSLANPGLRVVLADQRGPAAHAYYGCTSYIPLASLPLVLTDGLECLGREAYLQFPERADPHSFDVAFAWRASKFDDSRSMPVDSAGTASQLGLILRPTLPELSASESDWLARQGIPLNGLPRNFFDVARIIANCSATLAVDTATAHLAAAMGKPTWLLLGDNPAPRWGLRGDSSVWYPTMRLVRKRRTQSWRELTNQALRAIANHIEKE